MFLSCKDTIPFEGKDQLDKPSGDELIKCKQTSVVLLLNYLHMTLSQPVINIVICTLRYRVLICLAIVLSVLLLFTASDCPFGIVKLLL
jgi:hypothetical protein